MKRIWASWAREYCAGCGDKLVDDEKTPGLFVTRDGVQYPHYICDGCLERAESGHHKELAGDVEFRLVSEGHA